MNISWKTNECIIHKENKYDRNVDVLKKSTSKYRILNKFKVNIFLRIKEDRKLFETFLYKCNIIDIINQIDKEIKILNIRL